MPPSHLILCRPLLLLPPTPPSIRVFSNESTLRMRWPKYWSFSFSISPSSEHSVEALYSYTFPLKVERGKETCCMSSPLPSWFCPGTHQTLVSGPSPSYTATVSHLSTWPEESTFALETFSSTPEHHIEWVMCVQSLGQTYKLRILTDPFPIKETRVQKDKYSA